MRLRRWIVALVSTLLITGVFLAASGTAAQAGVYYGQDYGSVVHKASSGGHYNLNICNWSNDGLSAYLRVDPNDGRLLDYYDTSYSAPVPGDFWAGCVSMTKGFYIRKYRVCDPNGCGPWALPDVD
ncbi:hypothetical protein [Cryptosporangium aurantiacum]|uniref:Secreted protein n=1 Tax=Cryptosporangium aurantiacum TaxID=134849 RepID=A0A1M7RL23_9ACTN|nr:hypothetical protein [Cryptosporangium aurantiacum]SHN46859.1 hypothetical protein SAMN05443668_11892 [Cryptosporangium aurantiacum]